MTVFSNPATDVLNIESNGMEVEQITLFDLRGSLILNSAYHGQSIPLDDLPAGVYQLHIYTD